MICSKIITRTLFHSKYLIPTASNSVSKTHRNIFRFSNFKPPLPTDIDVGNLAGLWQAN